MSDTALRFRVVADGDDGIEVVMLDLPFCLSVSFGLNCRIFCYPDASKREAMRDGLVNLMSAQFRNTYGDENLRGFVGRVVAGMDAEQVDAYVDNESRYARAIVDEVSRQARDWCHERFMRQLNTTIVLEPAYEFPSAMTMRDPLTKFVRTLYEAESGAMNDFELKMADALSNSERILWWHRVSERREGEFCINGFLNHYPDFIAMTADGGIMAIETKGEQLKNDDSRDKLELGTRWALMAGPGYRYAMVFAHDALKDPNAFSFDEFAREFLAG